MGKNTIKRVFHTRSLWAVWLATLGCGPQVSRGCQLLFIYASSAACATNNDILSIHFPLIGYCRLITPRFAHSLRNHTSGWLKVNIVLIHSFSGCRGPRSLSCPRDSLVVLGGPVSRGGGATGKSNGCHSMIRSAAGLAGVLPHALTFPAPAPAGPCSRLTHPSSSPNAPPLSCTQGPDYWGP